MEQTQTTTGIESFNFAYYDVVIQKIPQPCGGYLHKLVSKTLQTIPITADHENKTVTVNQTTYSTSTNYEYAYKIHVKKRNIEVNDFNRFVDFLKKAGEPSNLWNTTVRNMLQKLQVLYVN